MLDLSNPKRLEHDLRALLLPYLTNMGILKALWPEESRSRRSTGHALMDFSLESCNGIGSSGCPVGL